MTSLEVVLSTTKNNIITHLLIVTIYLQWHQAYFFVVTILNLTIPSTAFR